MHLFSDEARCFSQSERALYGNFIMTGVRSIISGLEQNIKRGKTNEHKSKVWADEGPALETSAQTVYGGYLNNLYHLQVDK